MEQMFFPTGNTTRPTLVNRTVPERAAMLGPHIVEGLDSGVESVHIEWPKCFDPVIKKTVIPYEQELSNRRLTQQLDVTALKQLPDQPDTPLPPNEIVESDPENAISADEENAQQSQQPMLKLTLRMRENFAIYQDSDSSESDVSDDESVRLFSSETSESCQDEHAVGTSISDVVPEKPSDTKPRVTMAALQLQFADSFMSEAKSPEIEITDDSDDVDINSFSSTNSNAEAKNSFDDNRENGEIKCAENFVLDDARNNDLGEFNSEKIKIQQEVLLAAIKADAAAKAEQKSNLSESSIRQAPQACESVAKKGSDSRQNSPITIYMPQYHNQGINSDAGKPKADICVAEPGESDEDYALRLFSELNQV